MKRAFSFLLALVSLVPAMPVRAATIAPGDLIKASGAAVYYFAENGKRYVFPTEKTYKSWYADFSQVKTITDAELALIAIGGNVTYRPGMRLLKVTTDPRTYAVDARSIRWIKTEALAIQLYGASWATQVDDLPDPFFINYQYGAEINAASDYAPTASRDAYPTIQSTLTGSAPAPTPTPTPTPTPAPSGLTVTITPDKATAQTNEKIFLLAQTSYTGAVDRLEIYADEALFSTCMSGSCSTTWSVPSAGVKSSYTFRAKLVTADGRVAEATTSTAIVALPVHAAIQITTPRSIIRQNQSPNIRSLVSSELNSIRTEIYIDGVSKKACTVTPDDCKYTDYITGDIGSVHEIYAVVNTATGLRYKSQTLSVAIGTNDTPTITLAPGIAQIYPNQTVDVSISAQDDDGIASMRILHNGQVLKTCVGAVPCSVVTGPWNLAAGSVITFTGEAYDLLHATATAMTSVTVIAN